MKDVIKEIAEHVGSAISRKSRYVSVDGRKLMLDVKNFLKIGRVEGKVAFVDGGNAEVVSSPSISVQFIRVFYCVYGKEKLSSGKKEFYVMVKAGENDTYTTKTLGGEDFGSFSSVDRSMMTGSNKVSISRVGELCRKIAEIRLCRSIKDVDMIVRDGDLEPDAEAEVQEYSELVEHCSKNNILLCGLSKTTSLFTDTGDAAAPSVLKLAPPGIWVFYDGGNIGFARLHEGSRYVFRLDTADFERAGGLLAQNSNDAVFLGYPYGLVEADRRARVSRREAEYLKTKILGVLGRSIEPYINSTNAHDILDSIG